MIIKHEIAEEVVRKLLRETVDRVANWEDVKGNYGVKAYEEFELILTRTSYMGRLGTNDYMLHVELNYRNHNVLSGNFEILKGVSENNSHLAKLAMLILEREAWARKDAERRATEQLAIDTKDLIDWVYEK